MKKTLFALALSSVMFSAHAADFQVYGAIDYGLQYAKQTATAQEDQDTFSMESGLNETATLGLEGKEDLGNQYAVLVKLEHSFAGDTGQMNDSSRLFNEEAALTLVGPFGEIAMGRMGAFTGAAGTYDIFFGNVESFDGGDGAVVTGFAQSDVYNNTITYATPEWSGLRLYGQYSFETGTDQRQSNELAHSGMNERYAAIGATYTYQNLTVASVIDTTHYGHAEGQLASIQDDAKTFNFGASYDFGFAKFFGAFQVARNVASMANADAFAETFAGSIQGLASDYGYDGQAYHLGAIIPVSSGELTVGAYYATMDLAEVTQSPELKYVGLATRYTYPLSERTSLYAGAGLAKTDIRDFTTNLEMKNYQAYAGLSHTF